MQLDTEEAAKQLSTKESAKQLGTEAAAKQLERKGAAKQLDAKQAAVRQGHRASLQKQTVCHREKGDGVNRLFLFQTCKDMPHHS